MFSKVINQSNPIFGKLVFRTDREMTKKMTDKGFITPLTAVILSSTDKQTHEAVNVSGDKINVRLEHFLYSLRMAALDLDERIKHNSQGTRRAFLFVTVRGNAYLKKVRNDANFNKWLRDNNIGVYMTSSFLPNGNENDYDGGGQIKKANEPNWTDAKIGISDFIDIINGCSDKFPHLNLTTEETNNNVNILLNIEQANTGVNLPALNGVFISRLLKKDDPLALQIPGRCCRQDYEDIPNVNTWNIDPEFEIVDRSTLVKPKSYIYFSADEFSKEEFIQCREVLDIIYSNFYMTKPVILEDMEGLGKEDEPDNSNKKLPKTKEGKEWKLKFDTHKEVIDLLSSTRYDDAEALRYKFFKYLKAVPMDVRMKYIKLTDRFSSIDACPKKDWVILVNMIENDFKSLHNEK
jgi:hypothetical protein